MKLLLSILLLSISVAAQGVKLTGPEPAVVRLGERAVLVLESDLVGARPGPLPLVDDLEITMSPADDASAAPMRRTVELRPLATGTLRVPPFTFVGASKVYASKAAVLEVVRDKEGARFGFAMWRTTDDDAAIPRDVAVLRFGIDRSVLRERVISPFTRSVDLLLDVQIPRLVRHPSAATIAPPREERSVSVPINGNEGRARVLPSEVRDGREYDVFEVAVGGLDPAHGVSGLSTAWIRVVHATQFEEDIFAGRKPLDRHEAFLYADARAPREAIVAGATTAARDIVDELGEGMVGKMRSTTRRQLVYAAILLPLLLTFAVEVFLRRRERDLRDPLHAAARRALSRLRRRLRNGEGPPAAALEEFLEARLMLPTASIVDPGLAGRLIATGVDGATAVETASLLRSWCDRDYGGGPSNPDVARVRDIAAKIDDGMRRGRTRSSGGLSRTGTSWMGSLVRTARDDHGGAA